MSTGCVRACAQTMLRTDLSNREIHILPGGPVSPAIFPASHFEQLVSQMDGMHARWGGLVCDLVLETRFNVFFLDTQIAMFHAVFSAAIPYEELHTSYKIME